MANPNPQNKFQKGNKVAGRKPGRSASPSSSAAATSVVRFLEPGFRPGLPLANGRPRGPGLGIFVVYLGHALDSSNLCPGSSKVGLVLLICNLLSTQWLAYYFSPIFNSANY